ncbi:MAG: HIT domain-containing protein [Pseudomonadota bacterium]
MTAPCPFCLETGALKDTPLFRGEAFYVLGHLIERRKASVMIVPYRHIETPFDFTVEEWAGMKEAMDFAKTHLAQYGPAGYTVGWNVGRVGGQTVSHVHLHVVCRFAGEPAEGDGIDALLREANGIAPRKS